MKIRIAGFCLLVACIALILPAQSFAVGAKETVETEVNKVLAALGDPAFKGKPREEKIAKIGSIIGGIFDFGELSKRTVGRDWKKMSAAQQEEFIELFSGLLQDVYADRLLAYSDEKIKFGKTRELKTGRVEVESAILMSNGNSALLNYRCIEKDGQWKVYDIVIEGISMIKNYRSQFKPILTRGGPEELLKVLRKKVKG